MSRFQRLAQSVYDHAPPRLREYMIARYSARRSRAKFGPRYQEHLSRLRTTQWYSPEAIDALQDHLLRTMVAYAAEHVPHWRELFARLRLDPRDIRTRTDLGALPVLTKDAIRERPEAFRSDLYPDGPDVERYHTSGTTGEALEIAVTLEALKLEKAFTWLHREWGGVALGDRVAAFIGYSVVPIARRRPPFWVYDKVENRLIFSLHHMSEPLLGDYARALADFRPEAIIGYPTAIYLMALWLRDHGVERVRPRAVFTASETLLARYRQVIEEAFGCRVLDWYGASEFIANIVQCEQGRYHVKQEYGLVEVLDEAGAPAPPGRPGRLICSGLNNHAMPLLRYQVGDTAARSAESGCPCGRAGKLMEGITGRIEDVIVTPDGRHVSRLDFIFKTIENVREAQMIQDEVDHLRVRVVPRDGYGEADAARIVANLRERLGERIRIEIETVDAIPRLASGKFRYVVSRVPLRIGGAAQAGRMLGVEGEEDATL